MQAQFTRHAGIVAPSFGSVARRLREQEIFAWLPKEAQDAPATNFANLQEQYGGELQIIREDQAVVLQLPIMATCQKDISSTAETLRTRIHDHLGYDLLLN